MLVHQLGCWLLKGLLQKVWGDYCPHSISLGYGSAFEKALAFWLNILCYE